MSEARPISLHHRRRLAIAKCRLLLAERRVRREQRRLKVAMDKLIEARVRLGLLEA